MLAEPSQNLVHEVLIVVGFKLLLGIYQLVQISLHELSYYVNVVVSSWTRWLLNVDKLDDIVVIKKFCK
jgi:hypothetical protein